MSNMKKIELIDMAINMLQQAKDTCISLQIIRSKLDQYYDTSLSDALCERHCYKMIRSGVGIIEVNIDLANRDLFKDLKLMEE